MIIQLESIILSSFPHHQFDESLKSLSHSFFIDPCLKVHIDLVLNLMEVTTFLDLRTSLFIL